MMSFFAFQFPGNRLRGLITAAQSPLPLHFNKRGRISYNYSIAFAGLGNRGKCLDRTAVALFNLGVGEPVGYGAVFGKPAKGLQRQVPGTAETNHIRPVLKMAGRPGADDGSKI